MGQLTTAGLVICIELFGFCILILTVLFLYSVRFISRDQFKTSRLILIVNLCYGVVVDIDLIDALVYQFPPETYTFSYIVNTIRYIMYIAAALFWFLYCQREFKSRLFTKKIYVVLTCIPAAIAVCLILVSPFNGMVFSIVDFDIIRGPYYWVIQYIEYVYIVAAALFAAIRIFKTDDKDEKKRNRAIIIFVIPIFVSDILQAILGFPLLCVGVAIALTMVFVNHIIEAHYTNERKELLRKQRRDALVNGLTDDYEAVFIVDVDDDTIKSIRINETYILIFDHAVKEAQYSSHVLEVAKNRTPADYEQTFMEEFDAENVWEKLEENISYAISFKALDKSDEELYYRAKFVRLQDADGRRFILGFRNVDSEIRQQIELEKLREDKAVRERTSQLQSIIEAMTSEYVMLAVLNLDTGELDKYRMSENYKAKMVFDHTVDEYDTLLVRFADEFVEKEYRDAFVKEMNSNTVIQELSKRKLYSVRFKLMGVDRWYEVNLSDYDETTGNVVIGARNIDEVVRAERHREELARELENARQQEFIAGLTQDFDCVSYIDVNNNYKETFYRTSPVFYERTPEKARKSGFVGRMKAYSEIFVVPEDREKFLREVDVDNLRNKLKEKSVYFASFRINTDGYARYYQVKFIANRVEDKLQGIIAGFHDVDDEMKAELERQEILEKAKQAAEEGSQAKTMFLFNMSHDIRTPMNAIMGFTNMAMKNIDDKERAIDALNKTQESSKVLLSLINQILDMSRIESGKVVLSQDKVDMSYFGRDVTPMMQELANNKNIDFTFNIEELTDRYVVLDRVRINEVIVNIVGNAIKYTQNGGRVNANLRQLENDDTEHGLYEFKVADNGFGMSKEFQEHLFENFAREETSSTRGIQGTGLGLPLCKKIVDIMNGTIEVESEEDVGTTFTITLPFKKREFEGEDEELYDERIEYEFNGKKILLAEDNELNREIAVDILKENGFVVEEASDGRAAVDMVRAKGEEYYDFILMDIRMPIMDGYEATKYIRGLCNTRHIPIIALSANAFEEDRAKSIKVGMDAHVTKPIEIVKLKKTLAKFL